MNILFIIFVILVTISYLNLSYRRYTRKYVTAADANPDNNMSPEEINNFSFRSSGCPRYYIGEENIDLSGSKYIRLSVVGKGLEERDIKDGVQVLALKLDKKEIKEYLKPKDIILIYVKEIKLYKIRIFKSYEDDLAVTYLYKDKDKIYENYPVSSIKGIIKYKETTEDKN